MKTNRRSFWGRLKRLVWMLIACVLVLAGLQFYRSQQPLPQGLNHYGQWHSVSHVRFWSDVTGIGPGGNRLSDQQIFDRLFSLIEQSRRFILLDMFYFNSFGAESQDRPLSSELTQRLISQKQRYPKMQITLITDPINQVYGSIPSVHLQHLRKAGIRVVITRLEALHDSNPVYSMFWRSLLRYAGPGEPGETLKNPIGEGRISVPSMFELINFKANHRKTMVADHGDEYVAFVSSANPHDASWAHDNIAVEFKGPAVMDLLETENSVLKLSGEEPFVIKRSAHELEADSTLKIAVRTESAIRDTIIDQIDELAPGSEVNVAMFYFAHRGIVGALRQALQKGVAVKLLLDPNRDAFGQPRNGIPNRQTSLELLKKGAQVRWVDTHGEQMHAKMMLIKRVTGESILIAGSGNFTRRNLDGYNLETDVVVKGDSQATVFQAAEDWFGRLWNNQQGEFSVDYDAYADRSWWRTIRYRFQEFTGMSTF